MCAIAGIVDFGNPAAHSRGKLDAMLRRLRHRGPDGCGVRDCGSAIVGANRLSQLDSIGGVQPATSPDGRWTIVFNGEIHNHRDLRTALKDKWDFRTRSDTEVLLAAIESWGVDALPRLNGMFAFFAWDSVERRGFAARDRLGVKPFAWCRQQSGFAFASEAKALLEILPSRPAARFDAVLEYFAAPFFSGVATPMFERLEYLAPGHVLFVSEQGIETHAWWNYNLHASNGCDTDTLVPAIRETLAASVARSLDTDAPAAVLLSGGLDSTAVAALARRHGPFTAYTIAFEGQRDFDYAASLMVNSDDTPFAKMACEKMGVEHRIVSVSRAQMAEDVRTLAMQNDALPAWEQEIAQHHLARAVSRDFRAVLVGDAADETHFGYRFLLDEVVIGHPRKLMQRFGEPPFSKSLGPHPAAAIASQYAELAAVAGHDTATRAGRLRATTHLIVNRWLPRLLHNGDIHSMAHGVEARVPFADAELLDLAVRVHPELGVRDGVEKSLLRESLRGVIPESIRTRRKSSLPRDDGADSILRTEAIRALEASETLIGAWLDVPSLRAICEAPGRLLQPGLLFRVIAFCHWAEIYDIRTP